MAVIWDALDKTPEVRALIAKLDGSFCVMFALPTSSNN